MRVRPALLFALALAPFALPLVAHATGIPFFGPIVGKVDSAELTCALGWGGLMQVVNNIIAFSITIGIVFIAPLLIAYAGFLYVVNPVSPASRSHANAILLNTIVGIVIALAAWLIVNAVLTALTVKDGAKGDVAAWTEKMFSTSGKACLDIELYKLDQAPQTNTTTIGSCPDGSTKSGNSCETCTIAGCDYTLPYGYACSGGGTFDQSTGQCQTCTGGDEGGCTTSAPTSSYATNTGTYGVSGQQCASDNTACSVSSLQAVGMTSSQANVMSCIAVTESSGDPNTLPYNVAHPESNSTACGTFQITQTTWNGAASGSCASFSNCTNAACNAQVAATLVSKNGYNDWTCAGCNSKAQGCVTQYSGT